MPPRDLLAPLVSGARGLVPRARRLTMELRTLVRLERDYYPGRLHPSMWRRGFISSRRYAYPGIEDRSLPYISDRMVETRLRRLNSPAARAPLEDKDAFAEALAARGLADRAPEVYGRVAAGGFRPRSPQALARMRSAQTVVVKPVSGHGGSGVRIVPPSEVEASAGGPGGELVVQERLRQHPDLAAIHPASLNTIRALAIRLPDGPVVAAAVHRWGTSASGSVDNVSSGGLCSWIDLATGRLGPAVGPPRRRRRVQHDRHPDTGAPITGVVVPQWPELLALALRLMDAFPDVEHVGWDLCATDRGPLVVEGNPGTPNLNVFQFHGPFVQDDARVRQYYTDRGLLPAVPA